MGGESGYAPLFETREMKGRAAFRLFALSVLVGICSIWFYRLTHIPAETSKQWVWLGLLASELFFGVYWVLNQAARWKPVYRHTFKERLSQRYEKELPKVDIFVCTADAEIEPPLMVVNTVLSMMTYNYPSEKLNVYLSDDGCSDLTFYALLEASRFCKHWIPFCKKFNVEPRSPAAYFSSPYQQQAGNATLEDERRAIKKLYEKMESQIETTVKLGRTSEEIQSQHEGFAEWHSGVTRKNHQTILKVLLDGRDPNNVDADESPLPTLVYLAREKRPQHPHNFKAGAMNALIRVSSAISNGQIILNVDCDMYSNNSESVRDVLCFFMDEEKGNEIAYVQFPQTFNNNTKNNIYESELTTVKEMDFHGLDGFGGPAYIGTGCFHRRESLCGRKYDKGYNPDWKREPEKIQGSVRELEQRGKQLASSTFEETTLWGKEMGLRYGCAVEDVITGLAIKRKGWRSIYFNPAREGFMGVGAITLEQALVQRKRWAEGHLDIVLSKYSVFRGWNDPIQLGLRMVYSIYNLWAATSVPTLYYSTVPLLCLYTGSSLFPKMSSPWFIPFAYVISAHYTYGFFESLWCGATLKGWWNVLRMELFFKNTSYLFGFLDAILQKLGFSKSSFVVTAKVADEEVNRRYENEMMEFGSSSPMFIILSTLGFLNIISLGGGLVKMMAADKSAVLDALALQFLLSGCLILVYIPVYEALFFRKDKGSLPSSVAYKSLALAVLATGLFHRTGFGARI